MAQIPPASIDQGALDALATRYTAAWNSGSPEAVAGCYAPDGSIVINRGRRWDGRAGVAEMAAGFFADVPDLALACDGVRAAGDHVVYLWTFAGTHAGSGRPLRVIGWEEWDLDADGLVTASRGWFDAADYARQTGAGAADEASQVIHTATSDEDFVAFGEVVTAFVGWSRERCAHDDA